MNTLDREHQHRELPRIAEQAKVAGSIPAASLVSWGHLTGMPSVRQTSFGQRLGSGLFSIGIGLLFLYLAREHLQQGNAVAAIGLGVLALWCVVLAGGIVVGGHGGVVPGGEVISTPTVDWHEHQDDFVELLRSTDIARLHVLRGMLEVNGVEVRLQDTEASSVFGGIPGFSAKLLVVRSDVHRAKALLDRAGA